MTLLRHTDAEVKERSALTINPAKTCQPIGAIYAALGVHGCLPHSHGSQGCCSYHRSQLTRHYKEPVMAATSSFTEGSSVFGGQANLIQAIDNIFTIYKPEVIAVHTTCLSETIGDDIVQIAQKAKESGKIPEGKCVFHANTPSYQGSHVTGFANMVKAMVDYFSEPAPRRNRTINLIPGWVEPADMRELKRMVATTGVTAITFPDTSDVLDAPMTKEHKLFPDGGVTIDQLRQTGASRGTLALGPSASGPAGRALDVKCKVDCEVCEIPYGLRATDRFFMALRELTGCAIPDSIAGERGRLVDLMCDMQQYFYNKTVALWGDPDQLVPLTEFCIDLGMRPKYVVTGTPTRDFDKRMEQAIDGRCEVTWKAGRGADMYLMHQWIKRDGVDLLIGGTHGKYIARDEDIPIVRHGFPVLDRIGHQHFPTVGYRGATRLAEQILDAFMDRQDRDAPEERFELVM